jgi:hypothetical protein
MKSGFGQVALEKLLKGIAKERGGEIDVDLITRMSLTLEGDRSTAVESSVCGNMMRSSLKHRLSLLSFEFRLTSRPNP